MPNNRQLMIHAAVGLAALILGVALGHSMIGGATNSTVRTAPAVTAMPAPAPTIEHPIVAAPKIPTDAAAASTSRKSLEEILKGTRSGARTKELEEYVRNLAPADIGAALKQLRGMPDGSTRDLATGLMIAHWIETDPDGALKFAAQNHDFDYITSDVFQQLAGDDAQAALARAQAIADPNVRYQALRGVLSYMADSDPLGALALAGTLGSFPNSEPLSQMIYRQWSAVDPQGAAAQAIQNTSDQGWRSPVNQVLRNWASQDPLGAIAWTSAQGDPSAQAREIGQIVRQWSRDDMSAAANWINGLSPGSMRDSAASSLAFSLGGSDPAAALGWAQSISDVTQRDNAIQRLSREIMYRNPSNGAAILQAAGIPQNQIPPPPNPNGGGGRRRGP
jgi:hypothetical protein